MPYFEFTDNKNVFFEFKLPGVSIFYKAFLE